MGLRTRRNKGLRKVQEKLKLVVMVVSTFGGGAYIGTLRLNIGLKYYGL